jgi:mediator of replication checkpoint protein 1
MGSFEEIAVEILPLQERKEMDDFDGLDNHLDALLHHQTSRKPQVLLESGSETSHVTSFSSARNSDDEDLLIQPRGRLAARMVAEDSETEQQPKESARDRVRRMLMSKANTARMSLSEAKDTQSEDEDVPVPSRRRKAIASKASTPRSSPPKRGGLFVSPSPEKSNAHAADSDSDSDLPADVPAMTANERFMALVEKKRQERLAKEEKEQREKKEAAQKRLKQAAQYSRILEDDDLSGSEEDDGGRRLTQQARPTRKASKKALEDMHRETQRMARNMQLAHQPKTKKKITKSSLFAKFNYKPEGFMEDGVADSAPSSSPRRTDPEIHDTPPTSPSSPPPYDKVPEIESQQPQQPEESRLDDDDDDELPSLEDVTSGEYKAPSPPRTIIDKGKGKAIEQPSPPAKQPLFTQRPIRVIPPKVIKKPAFIGDDSDSDLEIIPKSKKDTIFDRIPQQQDQQSHSLHTLRMLAHLTSPGKQAPKKNARSSMTASELQLSLQQRARQQAAREREERLHDLKARGIIVQTAEERNNEMAEVEDLMAKARREADEIAKEEKAAGKKERQANGEEMFDDSSADEDYEEIDHLSKSSQAGSENGDESDDSEREDEFDEEELEDSESVDRYLTVANPLFGQDASESETAEDDQDMIMDEDAGGMINDEEELPMVQNRRRAKNVISDDEDDDLPAHSPTNLHTDSPAKTASAPGSVLRSAKKTFIPGLPVAGPAGLSLTQIFAGTMDESQDFDNGSTQSPSQRIDTEQDSLAFLRNFPAPDLPSFRPTMDEDSQDFMVDRIPESQPTQAETQGIQLSFSQSQVHGFDSLVESASQFSEFPEATQDLGFQYMSPIQGRFAAPPQSTVDTVLLQNSPTPESNQETPIVKKKGKLMRRLQAPVLSDDEEPEQAEAEREDEFEITANVFDVMRKASKKKTAVADDFDKKKSAAKEMVQEQADESEDEYAGLGGASDDESGEEDDALVREMIDDNTKNVDESKLAAFYA